MYETILKIIDNPQNCPEMSAKEIAETFERFNEWKEFKSGFGLIQRIGEVGYVNFAEGSKKIYTYSELFTYWNTNIKDK